MNDEIDFSLNKSNIEGFSVLIAFLLTGIVLLNVEDYILGIFNVPGFTGYTLIFFSLFGFLSEIGKIFKESGSNSIYTKDIEIGLGFFFILAPIWIILDYFNILNFWGKYIIIILLSVSIYGFSRGAIGLVSELLINRDLKEKPSLIMQGVSVFIALVSILITMF